MWRLITEPARILKSIVSDSGSLFKNIQDCEKDVQKDADMADKEGLASRGPHT